ncbi:cation diffusion facilitator family transporter [cf. Phormidesmis sp. LEGE 11477]|uniref:cation diffusion facilitator family transporter n=1 Tax=cf. Phormidesmis sp. LEGE 11477 TaxID=1828680 RepID=UPI00187E0010|nr:cation diffusion facilitator family transporter [cf. Phormidesmis sp. LEGE 11477]MBE9061174.1 cation diffusion facilitator family transporter [cf. Phormidesmis sp. LEGE 11477]
MSTGSSKVSIYAAMAANVAIGIAKFVGAYISGSSAMLSEGIHSVVDSVNEVLLLYGLKQSETGPDEQYPLGRSQELYFWSLMVAVLIFALGGGVSVFQGIRGLQSTEVSSDPIVSYCVLGAAAVFEGAALTVSIREFKKAQSNADIGLWKAIRQSKDPSSFIVIVEDSAALVGLLVAFTGVWLSETTGDPMYDAIASIAIGGLLTVVATALVAKTKGLLVGESASLETRESIRTIVRSDDAVSDSEAPITLHLGPKDIMLALNIEFRDELSADEIEAAVRRIEKTIRGTHTEVKRIFIEAASVD